MATRTAVALVAIVGMVLTAVTVALALHVDTRDIFAMVSLVVGPVITFMLYGKVEKLENTQQQVVTQTNGNITKRDDLVNDMWSHNKDMQMQFITALKDLVATLPKTDTPSVPQDLEAAQGA